MNRAPGAPLTASAGTPHYGAGVTVGEIWDVVAKLDRTSGAYYARPPPPHMLYMASTSATLT